MRRFFPVLFAASLSISGASIALARLPGDTITNSKGTTLQTSVRNDVIAIELKLASNCKTPRITQAVIVGEPNRLGFGRIMRWNERWTVDRCGTASVYLIHFDFRGSVGTYKIEAPRK